MSYSRYDISLNQSQAIYNTGNTSLNSIMQKGNNYQTSGDYSKASVYHQYAIDSLKANHGISFTDKSSVSAISSNSYYMSSSKK
jgi:hypothetical protein